MVLMASVKCLHASFVFFLDSNIFFKELFWNGSSLVLLYYWWFWETQANLDPVDLREGRQHYVHYLQNSTPHTSTVKMEK